MVGLQALIIIAAVLLTLYAVNSLTPAINAAKDAGEAGKQRFERLHRRSVILNGLVMILLMGLIVAFVARPSSRTKGIIEPSPLQRTLLELKSGKSSSSATTNGLEKR